MGSVEIRPCGKSSFVLTLSLGLDKASPIRILCLGAHSDDIEIGCGGTLLKVLRDHPVAHVLWVVFSADQMRAHEARMSAGEFLSSAAYKEVRVEEFPDGFFPGHSESIKLYFEDLKRHFQPDLIFTHRREDLHQDHRLLAELTWNTFRSHLILEYEIVKYDGDLGQPNVFVALDRALCDQKTDILLRSFQSQRRRTWFTEETFMAIMRIRGVEGAATGGLAEGFYARKICL